MSNYTRGFCPFLCCEAKHEKKQRTRLIPSSVLLLLSLLAMTAIASMSSIRFSCVVDLLGWLTRPSFDATPFNCVKRSPRSSLMSLDNAFIHVHCLCIAPTRRTPPLSLPSLASLAHAQSATTTPTSQSTNPTRPTAPPRSSLPFPHNSQPSASATASSAKRRAAAAGHTAHPKHV